MLALLLACALSPTSSAPVPATTRTTTTRTTATRTTATDAIRDLERDLRKKDPETWRPAVAVLAKEGTAGAEVLGRALEDKRVQVRVAAARALAGMGVEAAGTIPILVELLDGHQPGVGVSFGRTLGLVSISNITYDLVARDPQPWVKVREKDRNEQLEAVWTFALGSTLIDVGAADLDALQEAIELAEGPAAEVGYACSQLRVLYAMAARKAGDDGVAKVEVDLESADPSVRAAAAMAASLLAKEHAGLLQALADALDEPEPYVRLRVIEAVRGAPRSCPHFRAPLVAAAADVDASEWFRALATSALARHCNDPDLGPQLVALLESKEPLVRAEGLYGLQQLTVPPAGCAEPVVDRLKDKNAYVRAEAIATVMHVAPDTKGLESKLRRLAKDKSKAVSNAAEAALRQLGSR